jgi:hypothetical protein
MVGFFSAFYVEQIFRFPRTLWPWKWFITSACLPLIAYIGQLSRRKVCSPETLRLVFLLMVDSNILPIQLLIIPCTGHRSLFTAARGMQIFWPDKVNIQQCNTSVWTIYYLLAPIPQTSLFTNAWPLLVHSRLHSSRHRAGLNHLHWCCTK